MYFCKIANMRTSKLFIGQSLRELRLEHELTQAAFADSLGLSTSYLNQMENNQRHVTASVLLALAERYSVDIGKLSSYDHDRLLADLVECFADPLFKGRVPSAHELRLATQNSPSVARALITMHQALRRTSDQLAELDDSIHRTGSLAEPTPYEEVRDYFHFTNNYLHDLDERAEALANQLDTAGSDRFDALSAYAENELGLTIEMQDSDSRTLRDYNPVGKLLRLNRRHSRATRAFQLACQVGLIEHHDAINTLIEAADFRSKEAADICRIGIANYFAGAMLMPYANFHAAAKRLLHDLVLLADEFDTSIEQVAHRLSTLQRPGLPGVPIFFARVDRAGNITKRHSATKLQFARFGSACPLWNAHKAFESPGQLIRQLAETPDGEQYLCVACTVDKPSGGYKDPNRRYALALGCEVKYIDQFVYGAQLDPNADGVFERIGVSCRICERSDCVQRAAPPLKSTLSVNQNVRRIIPYGLLTN